MKRKKIKRNDFRKVGMATLLVVISCAAAFCQNQHSASYHTIVLSKLLRDSAFVSQFNLVDKSEMDSKGNILVFINRDYKPIENNIDGYKVLWLTSKENTCNVIKKGEHKTVITMSSINIIDKVEQFSISVACYEVYKNKNECIWKIFAGGTLLSANDYHSEFLFVFDRNLQQWRLE
jgi:hypothetical protein